MSINSFLTSGESRCARVPKSTLARNGRSWRTSDRGRKKCSMRNAFRRNKIRDFFRSLCSLGGSRLDALSVLIGCKRWWRMNAGFPTSASPAVTLSHWAIHIKHNSRAPTLSLFLSPCTPLLLRIHFFLLENVPWKMYYDVVLFPLSNRI